jgi:hypothetical protein
VLLNCDIGGGGLNDGPGHAVTLVTAIPEPSTGLLFGFGLGVVGRMTWKKRTH